MFSLADGSRRSAADGSDVCDVQARSFVLGTRGQGYTFQQFGTARYATVRFRPGGLAAFVRVPLAELTGIYAPLECIWERAATVALEAQLAACDSHIAQAALLNRALLARLAPPDHLARMLHAVQQIERASNMPNMAMLAAETNLSQKHFERLFQRYVGFRPNLHARIVRFQRALGAGMRSADSLSMLAHRSGYYDQAHFTREFKHFAGLTPGEFFAFEHRFITLTNPPKSDPTIQNNRSMLVDSIQYATLPTS